VRKLKKFERKQKRMRECFSQWLLANSLYRTQNRQVSAVERKFAHTQLRSFWVLFDRWSQFAYRRLFLKRNFAIIKRKQHRKWIVQRFNMWRNKFCKKVYHMLKENDISMQKQIAINNLKMLEVNDLKVQSLHFDLINKHVLIRSNILGYQGIFRGHGKGVGLCHCGLEVRAGSEGTEVDGPATNHFQS
jgi:hypothetical protein